MLLEFFDGYARNYAPYKGGNWCYEDGLVYRGLELLHLATGDERWLRHLKRLLDRQILAGPKLSGYVLSEYNIDNIRPGCALLYLHAVTGDPKYLAAAHVLADQLTTHPRTRSGVYWHKLRYPWQIWLDGLYMAAPFQIAYAHVTGKQELIEDSLGQVATALSQTYVAETGLYAHGVDEARQQAWADADTGLSRAHWSRALGWLAMCLVDIAELVGPEAFSPLEERTSGLLRRIAELRQPGGLWLQVIDAPGQPGNYVESSASAMFVYALERGASLGLVDLETRDLVSVLTGKVMERGKEGRLQMTGICEVAGLGGFDGRYRDGTAEYYLSEPVVADDAKGVGPLMMCIALATAARPAQELVTAT